MKLIFLATDASERTKKVIKQECEKQQIPVNEALTLEVLSKAIGKQNKVVIGIKDINFAKEMQKIISGGEIIG